MRLSNISVNIFLSIFLIFIFTGCSYKPSYETFEWNRNDVAQDLENFVVPIDIGEGAFKKCPSCTSRIIVPTWLEKREIYSEDRYIYIKERPNGCIVGYFTNRDDKPIKVLGWVILKGEEYCIEQRGWALI